MSLSPIHYPQFSSGLINTNKQGANFNVFIVILTAMFFFTVLAWFNFVLALYDTLTTSKEDHQDNTLINLGFALLWTVITISVYFVMKWSDIISDGNTNKSDEEPLIGDEAKSDFTPTISDQFETFDFGAI